MTLQSLTRWKAFGIHLAISALLALIVVTLVVVVWYPRPYFSAMGGEVLLRLLIGVDVALGPLLTLIVFDPAKPRLKYDLAVIAVLQLAALAYGGMVMFEARPVYTVFVKNRFDTVAANTIDAGALGRAAREFQTLPLSGPRVVAAHLPTDPQEQINIGLDAAAGGPDVANLPYLYEPYAQESGHAASVARPLVGLARRDRNAADQVSAFVATHGGETRSLGYVPVKARNRDFAAVLDRKTGEIVGYLAISPW